MDGVLIFWVRRKGEDEMDIDLFKWIVEKTIAFKIVENNCISVMDKEAIWDIESFMNDDILYPFLLVRACEYCGIYLKKRGSFYIAYYYGYREFMPLTNPDKSRILALKYVYEQEIKNES